MTDWQLLQDYAHHGSETAFETLVQRHVNMIHAAALRQVRDPDLAQDLTQAVFLLLARKAAGLRQSVIVGGWLYRTAILVARRAVRTRRRQQQREREAIAMLPEPSTDELWELLSPHLDAAMQELGARDRDAVVLRYLQQRSFREVAVALGVSEDAAKKRVARALEKLRTRLVRRGATVTALTLGTVLTAKASPSAPAAVVITAIKSGVAAGAGALASTTALHLAGGVAREWFLTKLKWSLAALASASMVLLFQARVLGTKAKPSSAPTGTVVGAAGPADSPAGLGAPTNAVAASKRRGMTLWIVEAETGMPLAGAAVHAIFYRTKAVTRELVADAQGAVSILPPDRRFGGLGLWIGARGHVPKCSIWKAEEAQLPENYTVKLNRGAWAAGRVVNEAGQPVAGVKIGFTGGGNKWNSRECVDYSRWLLTTGPQGEWTADCLAPDERGGVSGSLSHPDYAPTAFHVTLDPAEPPTLTLTILRGVRVTGLVKDSAGQPIAGARVSDSLSQSETHSDAQGRFVFPHVAPGRFLLDVSADRHVSFAKLFDVPAAGLKVPVTLAPTRIAGHSTLCGRVVDEAGKPFPGIRVEPSPGQPPLAGVDWHATTDDAGRFAWTEAPEGAVALDFSASWYEDAHATLPNVELAADGTEHVVTMPIKTVEVCCHVTDKSTGSELERFKVMGGQGTFTFLGEGNDGRCVLKIPAGELSRFGEPLRIQADGYLEQVAELPAGASNRLDLEIALEPARDYLSTVLLPDGTPAAGAQVALGGTGLRAVMDQPARLSAFNAPDIHMTSTLSDGTFRLAPRRGGERLLIVHDQGWAVVPVANLSTAPVVLMPWGRIEGVLRIGAGVGAGQQIETCSTGARFNPGTGEGADPGVVPFNYQTQTDGNGQFLLDKVPPGRVSVHRLLKSNLGAGGAEFLALSQNTDIEVRPGETARVVLGGQGVTVKGRLRAQPARSDVTWQVWPQNLRPVSVKADPNQPPPGYGFFCRPDGSFTVEDVAPDAYVLDVCAAIVSDQNTNSPIFLLTGNLVSAPVGRRKLDFVIPDGTEKEFDLGEVVVPVQSK